MFFHFLKIYIFWTISMVKGQKITQNEKIKIISGHRHISDIADDHDFGTPLKNDDNARCFFHFFKVLIFWVVG